MKRGVIHTDLGEEEEEDGEGGEDGDEATGEGAAVEVLVHFRVGIQVPQLAPELHHFSSPPARPPEPWDEEEIYGVAVGRGRREKWEGYIWTLSERSGLIGDFVWVRHPCWAVWPTRRCNGTRGKNCSHLVASPRVSKKKKVSQSRVFFFKNRKNPSQEFPITSPNLLAHVKNYRTHG
jgi:hypothetical protein